ARRVGLKRGQQASHGRPKVALERVRGRIAATQEVVRSESKQLIQRGRNRGMIVLRRIDAARLDKRRDQYRRNPHTQAGEVECRLRRYKVIGRRHSSWWRDRIEKAAML